MGAIFFPDNEIFLLKANFNEISRINKRVLNMAQIFLENYFYLYSRKSTTIEY